MRDNEPVPSPVEPERERSTRVLDLLDAIKRGPLQLTSEQESAMRDLGALVQREAARSAERRPLPPEPSGRDPLLSTRNVLVVFVVLFAALVGLSGMTLRIERRCVADFQAAVQSREASDARERAAVAGAEADRLSDLLIGSGVLRFLVVVLALLVLLRGVAARDSAEAALRRSHEEAWNAAEDRRVAQAEAERLGERLRAVLDHIDVGVTMMELDGSISVYNMAAERIHGAWREQMERLKLAGTHPPMFEDEKTVIPDGESPLGRALKGQNVRDARIFFRTPFRPNGYHLSVSAVPLRNHQGMLSGAVLMFSERRP